MVKKIDKEAFIELATAKFGTAFIYDLSTYANLRRSKIKVFCSKKDHFGIEHGWFEISPALHLRGEGGCKACQYSKGYLCRDKADFVFWAAKIHEDAYDYSDYIFIDGKTKGWIRCKINGHKPFSMNPNNHLSNQAGCPMCANEKAGYTQSVSKSGGVGLYKRLLEEGARIHSNKFDYSLVPESQSLRARDYVSIVCPKHGAIKTQISVHLSGHGCRKCSHEERAARRQKDQEEFIRECKLKWNHSDDYYSLVEYKGNAYPIRLKCPLHGPFLCSSAKGHRQNGIGCQVCGGNLKKSNDEIVRLSQARHGGLYDYSKVEREISSVRSKITIVCRIHGEFRQSAVGHYNLGYGCPKCGVLKSGLDNIQTFLRDEKRAGSYCELYLVGIGEYFKIGIAEDVYQRDKRNYDEYILIIPSTRAVCWVAEQYLLLHTSWMEPRSLPERFLNWPGRSELRLRELETSELIDLIEVVWEEAETLGWLPFAEKYRLNDHGYGWDPL